MIQRTLEKNIKKWLFKEKILIIKGARQVGKTTLMKKIQNDLEKEGHKTLFFSIDQELTNPLFQDVQLLSKFLADQFQTGMGFLFLDEFQYIKEAGLFLKGLFDNLKGKVQIICSGSSSLEISKNSEFLTGRKLDFYLPTLTFLEVLSSDPLFPPIQQKFQIDDNKNIADFMKMYGKNLKKKLVDYIHFGGYPEIFLTSQLEDKETLLKSLISTYIQKDVSAFLKVENITAFNNLIRILSTQIGNLVNKSELGNTLNVTNATVDKYLNILQGTYVFDFVSPFFRNIRKELSKMPKVYVNDFGIYHCTAQNRMIADFDLLSGSLVENFVYLHLVQQFGSENVFFYRTIAKSEVDFILDLQGKHIPLEVKFRNTVKTNVALNMKHFFQNYPATPFAIVITKDLYYSDQKNNIYFIPVYMLDFIDFLNPS